MKKFFISALFIHIFIATTLTGCSQPAKLTTIPLVLDEEKISVEFQQNNSKVPVSGKDAALQVTLKPEPFTLIVNGDKKIVSIMALESADLIAPLQASALVTFPGTGFVYVNKDLYVSDQIVETYEITTYTLQHLDILSFPAEKATNMANTLKKQFNTTPQMLISGRAYLSQQSDQDQNYVINTISENPIQTGKSIVLLVFIEKPSDDPFFKVLKWLKFDVKFE